MSYSIKEGKLSPPLRVQLTDGDSNPLDLSGSGPGYTLTSRLYRPDGTVTNPTVVAVPEPNAEEPLIIGSLGWAQHVWTTGETDLVGRYRFEIDATVSSSPRAFPGSAWVEFEIEPVLKAGAVPDDIVWGEVVALYSDADNVSGIIQGMILNFVNDEIDPTKFRSNGRLRLAKVYLAAHLAAFSQPDVNGSLGPVKHDIVGDLEVEYNGFSIAANARAYERTTYGQNYLELIRTPCTRGPFVIV